MKRALVLSLICVVGLAFAGFAQTLTGSWITEVCIDPQTTNWTDALTLTSTLGVTYAIGDWAFTSTTVLDEDGWVSQDFGVIGLFGLITVSSALGFTPVGPPAFTAWETTLGLNMAGVSFTGVFTLDATGSSLALGMVAGLGSAVEGSIDIAFGDPTTTECDFDFVDVTIGLDFLFCDCALINMEIYFSCTNGFEYVDFSTTGIALPNLPWISLDATLHFEVQTKEITLTPVFDLGPIVCFDIFIEAGDESATYPLEKLEFWDFTIVGIGIGCTIGGVDFYGLSMFDGSIGDGTYWEQYSIDVGADACCGGVFEFGLDMFFENGAATLFEVSLIEVDMKVNVTSQFAFTMGLDVDTVLGFTSWCVGFEVTW